MERYIVVERDGVFEIWSRCTVPTCTVFHKMTATCRDLNEAVSIARRHNENEVVQG